jgi:hypothetical protein
MSEAFDFDEQLQFGNNWEEQAKTHLQELFTAVSVSNIDYNQRPDLQRAGVDVLFRKEETTIDVKTQSHKYVDSANLPIEIVSVVEEDLPGWFWDSDSDLVVWVYPNKAKTNLHKTAYLMPLTDGLRDWFDDHADDFRYIRTETNGRYGKYHTGCRLVPIDVFPEEYLVQFDPRLPTERDTPQSDILKWVGGGDE